MRYDKPETILRLALIMQGSAEGVRLIDVQQEFRVSRRTAERMRDAVIRLFPQVEELPDGGRQKRWRIRDVVRPNALAATPDELTALGTAIKLLEREGAAIHADALRLLDAKLKAALTPASLRRMEPDLEALIAAEAIMHRPGPHVPIDPLTITGLRTAILAGRKVSCRYRSRMTGELRDHVLTPLGFLYGPRPFLVAIADGKDRPGNFALDQIKELSVLPDIAAVDPAFDLTAYAARSFGVFQDAEGPRNVVWRFTAHAASNARTYLFHPTQVITDLAGGGIEVRFTASSLWEMALHLFGWGPDVEVIEPIELREELIQRCEEALSVYEDEVADNVG